MTPTVLYSLGLPIPQDLEGRVPEGLFTSAHLAGQPIESGPPTLTPDPFPEHRPTRDEKAQEDDAEAEVMARLKALGYVE